MRSSSATFVGRRDELGDLVSALEHARGGRGGLVVVVGEAGVGKTRVCHELTALAGDRGMAAAWATCWESAAMPPYWPWRQLLDQLGADPLAVVPQSDPDAARADLLGDVMDQLRVASRHRQILLVLDDVQWADAATLRLLALAGPRLRSVPVMVVAAARAESATPGLPPEVLRTSETLSVEGLDAPEVAELMASLTGFRPSAAAVAAVHRRTRGNPLFVAEMVRSVARDGRLEQLATLDDIRVPPTIRAVLGDRLRDVSVAGRDLLKILAVVGRAASVALLAEVSGRDQQGVLVVVDEAIETGAVEWDRDGRFTFTHPLLASVVLDDLSVPDRTGLALKIAKALRGQAERGQTPDLAELSRLYAQAAPLGVAAEAVSYSVRAAEEAMAATAYEDAVAAYDRALLAHDLEPTVPGRASTMVGAGRARAAVSDQVAARALLRSAAALARREGDWPVIASAALAMAGSGFEVPLFDEGQIALLEEAHAGGGDDHPVLRSRLCARLSVALSLSGADERRGVLAEEAVGLAERAGDPVALGEAIAARCDTRAGPTDTELRKADATRIIGLAVHRRDGGTELLGRRLRLVALLALGDLRAVDAEIQAFADTAGRIRQARYGWYVPLWLAMRAAIEGRADEQRAFTAEAEHLGRGAGSPNSEILALGQRWFCAIERGDTEAAVADLEASLPGLGVEGPDVRMVPVWAKHRLVVGRPEEARAMLDGAVDGLHRLERDSEWVTTLAGAADLCFGLGGHDLAPWLYQSLAPFGHLWAVEGIGAFTHGSVHRHLGLLASLLGHADSARHFDQALESNRRAGATLLVARTLADRGAALADGTALSEAHRLYLELGAERKAEELASALVDQPGPVGAIPAAISTGPADAALLRLGDVWSVRFGGRTCTVRDAKGLHDLAQLLGRPGREISALDLVGPGAFGLPRGDLGETIDASARAAYRRRLAELESELDAADLEDDPERSRRATAERDALLGQLTAAYGLGGRARRTGDTGERARTAVTGRIRYSIRRLAAAHPELGRHLDRSVRTGTFCSYSPEVPLVWEL